MKGKEEDSERLLNDIEASQISDTEFQAMVIKKLNEVTDKLQENYNELSENYINMKKEIENIHKSKQKIKNTIS